MPRHLIGGLVCFLLLKTGPAFGKTQFENLPKATESDCGFYLKLEDQLKCFNEHPYLTHYGYPYCNRFQTELKGWRGKLSKWVPTTTYCLQHALVSSPEFLNPCKVMMDHAFGTHPTCYMKSGFCDLDYSDKQRILNVVAWSDIMAEFGESVAQGLRIKSGCNLSLFESFLHLTDFLFQVTRGLNELIRKDAAEIAGSVPIEKHAAQRYIQNVYAILYYGVPSGNDNSGALAAQAAAGRATVGESVSACMDDVADRFCQRFKEKNPALFGKNMTSEKAARLYSQDLLPKRLKLARKLLGNTKAK